ncbi:ABC transporter permease [Sporolactobacillus kofuensis]|uniref:Autoinducer 2 import system permease protein LsrD n=1 Tax=Sporolactobacillus kofuensis TaxID=269672 RepID=A0ABW1WC34_9BACL|nr:ABC transporter permease [Sporolactobacillus kofuensis]MCO7174825.1 ABC transporter permease [Sporolactobacillus kofuensis]
MKTIWAIADKRGFMLTLLLIITIAIMSFLNQDFLSIDNLVGITQFGAVLSLLAIGQSLVILSGRGAIDLSVGAMLSLSGVFLGVLFQAGMNIWVASLLAILFGGLLGLINGVLVNFCHIHSLIATLGTQYLFSSIALYLTSGTPVSGFPSSFGVIGQGMIIGIPIQVVLVAVPVYIIMWFMVYRTRAGREIYLLGTNDIAAKFSGIQVNKIRTLIFTLSGLLSGIGAVVTCSWLMTARADAGTGMEMESITVAVLGGIIVSGGKGHLGSVMLSVLIVTVLNSGLQIANIDSVWELAILGILLILAIVFNNILVTKKIAYGGNVTFKDKGE